MAPGNRRTMILIDQRDSEQNTAELCTPYVVYTRVRRFRGRINPYNTTKKRDQSNDRNDRKKIKYKNNLIRQGVKAPRHETRSGFTSARDYGYNTI